MKKILAFLIALCIVLQTSMFVSAEEVKEIVEPDIVTEEALDEKTSNDNTSPEDKENNTDGGFDETQPEKECEELETTVEDETQNEISDKNTDMFDNEEEGFSQENTTDNEVEEENPEETEPSESKKRTENSTNEEDMESEEVELFNANQTFAPVDESLWFDSERECPFDTGYELYEETEFIRNNSMGGQVFLSEDAYEGQFSLGIHAQNEVENVYNLLPVKITDALITDATVSMFSTDYFAKVNTITLYIKPKYNAQWISFYIYADDNNETNYKILGDANNDGMYYVGTDLAQGEWNKVSLSLNNIEALNASSFINSLYMCANDDSQWVIDNLTGTYNETISETLDISEMAKDNLLYSSNELSFSKDSTTDTYNITPVITTISGNIENTLTGIDIESKYLDFTSEHKANTISDNLLPTDIAQNNNSGLWHLGDNGSIVNGSSFSGLPKTYLLKLENDTSPDDIAYLNISEISNTSKRKKLIIESTFSSSSGYLYIRNDDGFSWKLTVEDDDIYEVILPANTEKIYFISKYYAYITSVKLFEISDTDYSSSSLFVNSALVDRTVFTETVYSDIYDSTTMSFAGIGDPSKIYGSNSSSISYSAKSTEYVVVKVINPYKDIRNYSETSSKYATIKMGDTTYHLGYGENEYLFYGSKTSTITINDTTKRNGIFITEISKYSYYKDIKVNQTTTSFLEKNKTVKFGCDANNFYYVSNDDYLNLYVYNTDTATTKKISDKRIDEILAVSPNGRYVVFNEEDSDFIYLYDNNSSELTIVEKLTQYISVSNNGVCTGMYLNDEQYILASTDTENDLILPEEIEKAQVTVSETVFLYISPSSEHAILVYKNTAKAYKKQNLSWIEQGTIFDTTTADMVAFDGNDTAYISVDKTIYSVDLSTLSKKTLSKVGTLCSATDDGRILVRTDTYMELYNPSTNESTIICEDCSDNAVYSNAKQRMIYVPDDITAIYAFSTLEADKFVLSLLSFDGGKTWKSYKNGSWTSVSGTTEPGFDTLVKYGLTSNEVSEIPESAFSDLYNNQEIYSIKIAMLVQSRNNNYTPTVSAIKIYTSPGETEFIYGAHGEYFSKSSYSKINTIYPIETKPSYAENYYFLALGDDAVFTYKNGSFVVVESTVENMVYDIEDSWIDIKQQGMTAAELSAIPSDTLTALLISDYDNEGFTIVNCIKTLGDTTKEITVEYRLSADNRYSFGTSASLEITMSDGTSKSLNNLSEDEIQKFFTWLEKRQAGIGSIYYSLDVSGGKIFINYYNILSVEVSA